jgi:excisionase family DNA binding protein
MIIVQLDSEQLNSLIQNAVRKVITEAPQAEQSNEADRWLNLNELCQYHPDKPSKPTVYGWVNVGTIPVHKGGKKLRFLKSEIDSWLRQGRKRTLTETATEAELYCKTKKG